MDYVSMDQNTIAYIESEAEFSRAKMQGAWEVFRSLLTGRRSHLVCFDEAVQAVQPEDSTELGLQDISLGQIIGSVGRNRDFTRSFLPCSGGGTGKERWRRIYTLAVTGIGFPPVELYKLGQDYFVKDGHHRISVAKYLAWDTIQAHVVELSEFAAVRTGRPDISREGALCPQL